MSQPSADTQVTTIFWRPGCGFCARLKAELGLLGQRARWVNVWEDDAASTYVRSVNDGNEIVPTVVMDGIPVTNPSPAVVRDFLASR